MEKEKSDMEEIMVTIGDPEKVINISDSEQPITNTTTSSTLSSWKLYENPFYYSQKHHHRHQHQHHHRVRLPLSARKIAASLWDLTFFRPIMDSEPDITQTQITELKIELEIERGVRTKVESLNKKLAKKLLEERKRREGIERVCEELAKEIVSNKVEIDQMKREMEEERKMLRMAEVLREERVQMKLAEAKILLEEKLLELEFCKGVQVVTSTSKMEQKQEENSLGITTKEPRTMGSSCRKIPSITSQRRALSETENPHIRRGIKGFVEFPRVLRAIGSRGRQLGSKLEWQKDQLRLLLRQKSPIRTDNLIMGG